MTDKRDTTKIRLGQSSPVSDQSPLDIQDRYHDTRSSHSNAGGAGNHDPEKAWKFGSSREDNYTNSEAQEKVKPKAARPWILILAASCAFLVMLMLIIAPDGPQQDRQREAEEVFGLYAKYVRSNPARFASTDVQRHLDETKQRLNDIVWFDRVGDRGKERTAAESLLRIAGDKQSPLHKYCIDRLSQLGN